jgi:hypothetical protein
MKDAGANEKENFTQAHPDVFSARIFIKRTEEEKELNKIQKATEALAPLGIRLSVGPNRQQGFRGYLACTLNIHIDREITSRGAGRRAVTTDLYLSDVEKMLAEGISPREVASKAEMSLATYYRHLRKAKLLKEEGERPTKIKF